MSPAQGRLLQRIADVGGMFEPFGHQWRTVRWLARIGYVMPSTVYRCWAVTDDGRERLKTVTPVIDGTVKGA